MAMPCNEWKWYVSKRCIEWYVSTQISKKFYYVYVLKSLKHDFIYVGFTADLKERIGRHNNKEELSTKHYAPFKLIFYEAYISQKDAKRREQYLKTTKGKTTLRTILLDTLKS